MPNHPDMPDMPEPPAWALRPRPNPPNWLKETQGAPIVPEPFALMPHRQTEREQRLEQALRHIAAWAETYPLPEDAAAANAMRHVIKDAARIAQVALDPPTPPPPTKAA